MKRELRDPEKPPGRDPIDRLATDLSTDGRVRARMPEGTRVYVDRLLPFLCVYRRPPDRDDAGTDRIVTNEASWVVAPGDPQLHARTCSLLDRVAGVLVDSFGSALILEVWSSCPSAGGDADLALTPEDLRPRFRIHALRGADTDRFVDDFEQILTRIRIGRQRARVEVVESKRFGPHGLKPLLPARLPPGARLLGLEVEPVFRDRETGAVFPTFSRQLLRPLTRALRRVFFVFARSHTSHRPRHYHVLGRRRVVKKVWEVDRRLAEVADGFDFLLQVTPINLESAWQAFKRSGFERAPVFHYRPLPVDPVDLKRKLWDTPVLRLDDPALTHVFREKQDELDRQLAMLLDLDTDRFLFGSLQLYGPIDPSLVALARRILEVVPPRARGEGGGTVRAGEFAERARVRLAGFERVLPELALTTEIRDDLAAGLMVSRGKLLIGRGLSIAASRVDALLAHEIGTHVLTWCNGRTQPFRLLACGLAGYEALQEGLAVLAEHLAGGLSRPRLRLLAGRVVAAAGLVAGATLVDTFRTLHVDHGFAKRTAFSIASRTHRGRGLTKDFVYLQGLEQVMKYVRSGGDLRPLFAGKIATQHIPLIEELRHREVLRPAPLTPWFLEDEEALARLDALRRTDDNGVFGM